MLMFARISPKPCLQVNMYAPCSYLPDLYLACCTCPESHFTWHEACLTTTKKLHQTLNGLSKLDEMFKVAHVLFKLYSLVSMHTAGSYLPDLYLVCCTCFETHFTCHLDCLIAKKIMCQSLKGLSRRQDVLS